MKLGIALSGGGMRGIAHAGVLKALEENDIQIEAIGGTSSGALIAGLYVLGYSPENIFQLFKLHAKDIVGIRQNAIFSGIHPIFRKENTGFRKGKNIEELFNTIKEFKKLKFPKNKLRYIYELKRKDNRELEDFEKKMEFINILSKMETKHIDLIKEKYNIDYGYKEFEKYFNNIFDIVELYDFIGGEADED